MIADHAKSALTLERYFLNLMHKQPAAETNPFVFPCCVNIESLSNSLLQHFNELTAFFFFFALLTYLTVMMVADSRNLIMPRGIRPDYLFCQLKKELQPRASVALSLLLSDIQLKNFIFF